MSITDKLNEQLNEQYGIVNLMFRNINNETFKSLYHKLDGGYTVTGINMPIFYLFDHIINPEIGDTGETIKKLITGLKLNEMFKLDGNIMFCGMSQHATVLYNFEHNGRKYIYYSNSGLHAQNQLLDTTDNTTACKIFFVKTMTEQQINNLCSDITMIISNIETINFAIDEDAKLTIWINIVSEMKIKKFITKNDYDLICGIMITNTFNKSTEQLICYALLNLAAYKYKFKECTFNHILTGNDNDSYIELIKEIIPDKSETDIMKEMRKTDEQKTDEQNEISL